MSTSAAQSKVAFEPMNSTLRALYRAATPTQKLATVARINHSLQQLKAAQLQTAQAELSAAQRTCVLRRWWLGAHD